ncbi:hypothetical protein JB92DRAFT_571023 [Gautieria morchelliformis]|nr:hypothetical protein JB92DRAFT_571023 [Gautieria morchelliformis]
MLSMLILILPSAFISISREPATRYPVHDQRKDPLQPLPWLRSHLQLTHPSHPTCSFPTCSTTRSTTLWALPRAASSCLLCIEISTKSELERTAASTYRLRPQ